MCSLEWRIGESSSMVNPDRLKAFTEWLKVNHAVILDPTNDWEVLRFKGVNGIGVIYKNKRDKHTVTGEAKIAWEAFVNSKAWNRVPTVRRSKPSLIRNSLLERDGNSCFYCGVTMVNPEDKWWEGFEARLMTVEHLLSITHGGTNHPANQVLACTVCNKEAGSMTLIDKIKLRDKKKGLKNVVTGTEESSIEGGGCPF
jgi:5-methylcytosine-specific restriction endonuclease McrA